MRNENDAPVKSIDEIRREIAERRRVQSLESRLTILEAQRATSLVGGIDRLAIEQETHAREVVVRADEFACEFVITNNGAGVSVSGGTVFYVSGQFDAFHVAPTFVPAVTGEWVCVVVEMKRDPYPTHWGASVLPRVGWTVSASSPFAGIGDKICDSDGYLWLIQPLCVFRATQVDGIWRLGEFSVLHRGAVWFDITRGVMPGTLALCAGDVPYGWQQVEVPGPCLLQLVNYVGGYSSGEWLSTVRFASGGEHDTYGIYGPPEGMSGEELMSRLPRYRLKLIRKL